MTEAGWLRGDDPVRMLSLLLGDEGERGRSGMEAEPPGPPLFPVSERKLRLFACACARQVWGSMSWRSQEEVESAELCADGQGRDEGTGWATDGTLTGCLGDVRQSCRYLNYTRMRGLGPTVQAALLRDIVGNPWRPVVITQPCVHCDGDGGWHDFAGQPHRCHHCRATGQLSPDWITWNDGTVRRLARAIYDEGRWQDLPLLADALLDAGCDSEELIRHCQGYERCWLCAQVGANPQADACSVCGQLGAQGPFGRPCAPGWVPLRGPHARGCWAVDLVLGKE